MYDSDGDILDQYLFEVSRTPLLTVAQEIAVAKRVQRGDEDAMRELVKRNLRFVISVAKKYQNRGMPLTDLIGEGNVGLMTAAKKFDPEQGVKFISYAVWWIRQSILASLARQGRTVRVPLNRTADLSRIIRTAEMLRQELRREPTPGGTRHARPDSRSTWCSRSRRSTPPRCASTRPLDADGDRSLIDRFSAEDPGRRRRRGDEPLPRRGGGARAPHAAGPRLTRSCRSTSASTAAASTRSKRSARCSASRGNGCGSCATGR